MKSIVSNDACCIVCGTTNNLHKHHIFYGTSNRKQSEKYGCWCYLCAEHHNMSNMGVHFNKELDIALKETCQRSWENRYGDRDDFRKVFGKSWL